MSHYSIRDLDLNGKRVFLRVDFNVPLAPGGQEITSDKRIRASLPSIQYALEQGAALVLASHLGRPKGKPNPEMSLKPVAARLGELLGRPVAMAPDCVGSAVEAMLPQPGGVLLLENLRFHAEEEKNDHGFSQQLARLCDVYVNDAFRIGTSGACIHGGDDPTCEAGGRGAADGQRDRVPEQSDAQSRPALRRDTGRSEGLR